jgi:hypothetical protein
MIKSWAVLCIGVLCLRCASDAGETVSDSLPAADLYIAQSSPHSSVYYVAENRVWLQQEGGERVQVSGAAGDAHFMVQSGPFLLILESAVSAEVKIFDEGRLSREIPLPPALLPSVFAYAPNRLFVGGFSADRAHLVFQHINDQGEVLHVEKVAFEDRTPFPHDAYRMSALRHGERWLVWVPARQEIWVFDQALTPVDVVAVAVPADLFDIADLFSVLYDEPVAAKRQKGCEGLIGQRIASLPNAFFEVPDGLAVAFHCATLSACGDLTLVRKAEPVETHISTELLVLDRERFEVIRRITIPDRYINGLYGSMNRASGRARVDNAYVAKSWEDISW